MKRALIRFFISIALRIGDTINAGIIILHIYKAHPVLNGELPQIQEKLDSLSNRAGVKVPSIYITELPLPGSFIIAKNPNENVLVFPKRLQNLMEIDQIEAMIAYNLAQINDNIRIRTFVALVASLLTMSSSAIRWGAVFTGFGNYNDPAPKLIGKFVMGLVAPPAATMVQLVNNDDSDARAAALCMNPEALASAIVCLEKNNVEGYSSLGFICLIDPNKETMYEQLFSSHLSRETRVKNLTAKEKYND